MDIGIIFKLQIKGEKRQLTSKLIGIEDGKYLIARMPPLHTMENVSSFLIKGNEIAVKYMYKSALFGFQSQIIDFIHKPSELIFIKYPDKIESYDFRGYKRVECFLLANIKITEHIIEGYITDISKTGGLFAMENPEYEDNINLLELNNEINIGFHLPGIEEELRVVAKRRSFKKDTDNACVGIEFVKMDSSVQTKLSSFLAIAKA
ncbi:MAG: flagellar brake protein [Candidatus Scalindua sp.]|nr:flagellar brake protein [Candidatus Scalindua sp.]